MSFFSGLDAEPYDRQYSDNYLARRIASYLRPYRSKLALATVALLSIAGLSAGLSVLVSRGVDQLAIRASAQFLFGLVAVIFVFGWLVWGLNYVRSRLFAELIGDVVLAMRSDAFLAAANHDLSFYDKFRSGRIVSRITSDTQEFGEALRLASDLLDQMAVVLILIVILVRVEWRLTVVLLALAALVFLMALGWRRVARRVTRQGTRAMANVNAAIQEAVTGISVAKNFRQEASIYAEFEVVNRGAYAVNVRRVLVLATVFPLLSAIGGVGMALLIYFGGRAASLELISVGAWYLFLASADRFWFPMIQLSAFWSQFQNGLSAAERIFALIDTEPVVVQNAHFPVSLLRGHIRFDRIDFRYSQQEVILTDFSLEIQPGESLALVGHTGAGKSSIVKLIARFYEFQSGRLMVDGHDIRSFDLRSYRRQLGIVSQDPFLFLGTVADNIRYASPEVRDEAILAAALQIGGGEWLETLRSGLDSDAGERGSRLSLGQRQLVALTRVLVQHPAVFILDEATASIDPFTEAQIQEVLDLILQNSTSIVIAHRLSTVRSADRIVVLREGEIIEDGDHDQLMAGEGYYAQLYDTYFRHQSLDYRPWNEVDATSFIPPSD